jgi:hypothetical protein
MQTSSPKAADSSGEQARVNTHGGRADGLDPRYEQLRHAALHARAEAFPLGFAVLTRRGVTGWRRALTEVSANQSSPAMPCSPPPAAAGLPAAVSAELIDALTAVALAGAHPDRGAVHHRNTLSNRSIHPERSPYPCSATLPHPR